MTYRIAVLCGGESTEHEISIISAKNITQALLQGGYTVEVIYITHRGRWYHVPNARTFTEDGISSAVLAESGAVPLWLNPGQRDATFHREDGVAFGVDVVFPALHGTHGEDGVPQGVLSALGLPYVGAPVLGSAIAMHKGIAKILLHAAQIPVVPWIEITRQQFESGEITYEQAARQLGATLFIKPAQLGSSVGVHKVKSLADWKRCVQDAFRYDTSILVEAAIAGRELECAVLGNALPKATWPGELVIHHEFYSYEAKYQDPNGATIVTRAEIAPTVAAAIQAYALKAFAVLQLKGLARIDFFLSHTGDIYLNEANTIPGFTAISMYPKMWEAEGLPYVELVNQLVTLALAEHQANTRLERVYQAAVSTQRV
ncbi:MAG: hypothetical protein A3J38_02760 [Gammaproteobacteria bacterium RIFCSPHIGHO2_12_FULL_45_9]|nr:MAG: hypothetical protein A3J38_02760 [Gammaproteobacteria bacterium RIFCSPHIGHO2_12_FULL_45_9]